MIDELYSGNKISTIVNKKKETYEVIQRSKSVLVLKCITSEDAARVGMRRTLTKGYAYAFEYVKLS